MEVLSAVASSIAVVQALAAGKHVVSIIREVPGIQDDFNYLMKEVRGPVPLLCSNTNTYLYVLVIPYQFHGKGSLEKTALCLRTGFDRRSR